MDSTATVAIVEVGPDEILDRFVKAKQTIADLRLSLADATRRAEDAEREVERMRAVWDAADALILEHVSGYLRINTTGGLRRLANAVSAMRAATTPATAAGEE